MHRMECSKGRVKKKLFLKWTVAHFGGESIIFLVVHNSIVILGKIKVRWYFNCTSET